MLVLRLFENAGISHNLIVGRCAQKGYRFVCCAVSQASVQGGGGVEILGQGTADIFNVKRHIRILFLVSPPIPLKIFEILSTPCPHPPWTTLVHTPVSNSSEQSVA